LARFGVQLVHWMDGGLGRRMLRAPGRCSHGAGFSIDRGDVMDVTPGALDRGNVKPELPAVLLGALDVDRGMAGVAAHRRTTIAMALPTLGIPFGPWNGWDALYRGQRLGVSKPDVGGEDGASHVHPVVVGSPLERLARVHGPPHILLLLAVVVGHLVRLLPVLALALAVLFRHLFLGVDGLGRLDKVAFRGLDCAEHAVVVLHA
jgi:hypothetical protein